MGWFTEADLVEFRRRGLIDPEPVTPAAHENRLAWSEKKFSAEFEKLFKGLGWVGYHTWISIRSDKGFLDWTLARGERLMFVELKKQKGQLTTEQKDWIWRLEQAHQEVHVWRPSDWEEIVAALA